MRALTADYTRPVVTKLLIRQMRDRQWHPISRRYLPGPANSWIPERCIVNELQIAEALSEPFQLPGGAGGTGIRNCLGDWIGTDIRRRVR